MVGCRQTHARPKANAPRSERTHHSTGLISHGKRVGTVLGTFLRASSLRILGHPLPSRTLGVSRPSCQHIPSLGRSLPFHPRRPRPRVRLSTDGLIAVILYLHRLRPLDVLIRTHGMLQPVLPCQSLAAPRHHEHEHSRLTIPFLTTNFFALLFFVWMRASHLIIFYKEYPSWVTVPLQCDTSLETL
jgi:hypothetical protein